MAVILTSSAPELAALRGHFLGKTAVVRPPSPPNKASRWPSVVHGEAVLFFGRQEYDADSLHHDCGSWSRSLTRLRRLQTAWSAWSPFALHRVADQTRIEPGTVQAHYPPRALTDRAPSGVSMWVRRAYCAL